MISVCYVVQINRILLSAGLVVGRLGMLRNCIIDARLGGVRCRWCRRCENVSWRRHKLSVSRGLVLAENSIELMSPVLRGPSGSLEWKVEAR